MYVCICTHTHSWVSLFKYSSTHVRKLHSENLKLEIKSSLNAKNKFRLNELRDKIDIYMLFIHNEFR